MWQDLIPRALNEGILGLTMLLYSPHCRGAIKDTPIAELGAEVR